MLTKTKIELLAQQYSNSVRMTFNLFIYICLYAPVIRSIIRHPVRIFKKIEINALKYNNAFL